MHLRDYQHKNTLLPVTAPNTVRRSDTEFTHVLGVVVPLPWQGLCVPNRYKEGRNCLTAVVEYQASRADSNIDVYSFNRNVVSATLVWTY